MVEGNVVEENGKVMFQSSDGTVVVPVTEGTQGPSSIVFRPQNLTIRRQDDEPVPGDDAAGRYS